MAAAFGPAPIISNGWVLSHDYEIGRRNIMAIRNVNQLICEVQNMRAAGEALHQRRGDSNQYRTQECWTIFRPNFASAVKAVVETLAWPSHPARWRYPRRARARLWQPWRHTPCDFRPITLALSHFWLPAPLIYHTIVPYVCRDTKDR